jgi:hypothetical protein
MIAHTPVFNPLKQRIIKTAIAKRTKNAEPATFVTINVTLLFF